MTRRLLLAIAFGVLLRLALINSPMLDAFGSMRQTYTAGYTRYMLEEGVSLSGLLNAQSVVITHAPLEIPIYNLLTVVLARMFGESDAIYRLTSLILWIVGALYLAYLLRRVYGDEALYIMWAYVLLPLSIFIGHYYHPEVLSLLLSMAVVFHFHFYLEKGKRLDLWISVVALALALIVRAAHFHLYFVLLFMGLSKYGWRIFRRADTYAFLLPLIPAGLWSMHGSDLTTSSRLIQYLGLPAFRFSPKFWGMIIFHRLGGLTLSPIGLPLLILAIAASKNRAGRGLEFAWLYGGLLFLVIVAKGNFHHPHYQAALLIPCSLVIGRFFYQVAKGSFVDAWQNWWVRIPRIFIVILVSIYIFLDCVAIYLFFTQPWDIEALKELFRNLNVKVLIFGFIVSQAVLIPFMMGVWRFESGRKIGPRPANAAILLILIFLTGLFVLHPMYRIDLDYIEAGKAVRANLGDDARIIFSGKKDDADPFVFYSGMRGWAFNPARFGEFGWGALDEPLSEGAEYLAIMNSNRYIQPEHEKSRIVWEYLRPLDAVYTDAFVTIYDLKGQEWD